MYYYIIDPPKNRTGKNTLEKIKVVLGFLGITGEMVRVSPARTVEELAMMGLEKGYSTIVAVGADELINQVASIMSGSGATLGVIPLGASPAIINLVGTDDPKRACEILQKRRLKVIDMACIEPDRRFLTQATIDSGKLLHVQAEIDGFYLETHANKIIIDYSLGVQMMAEEQKAGWWQALFGFGKKNQQAYPYSYFSAHKLKLRTHEIVPVRVGQAVIAKTPIVAHQEPGALKIISA